MSEIPKKVIENIFEQGVISGFDEQLRQAYVNGDEHELLRLARLWFENPTQSGAIQYRTVYNLVLIAALHLEMMKHVRQILVNSGIDEVPETNTDLYLMLEALAEYGSENGSE